jgi:predicted RNA-binding Zn-ribbon protein involved in translation (DUF1610 family)
VTNDRNMAAVYHDDQLVARPLTRACETEWRCPTWGCGLLWTLRRSACHPFGPAKACPNCGTSGLWVLDAHRDWPLEQSFLRSIMDAAKEDEEPEREREKAVGAGFWQTVRTQAQTVANGVAADEQFRMSLLLARAERALSLVIRRTQDSLGPVILHGGFEHRPSTACEVCDAYDLLASPKEGSHGMTCYFCDRPIDGSYFQQVVAWVAGEKRDSVILRQDVYPPRFAHKSCIRIRQNGVLAGQGRLGES